MILAENKVGMHYTPSFESPDYPYNKIVYKKLLITAIARPNCLECYNQKSECSNFVGI